MSRRELAQHPLCCILLVKTSHNASPESRERTEPSPAHRAWRSPMHGDGGGGLLTAILIAIEQSFKYRPAWLWAPNSAAPSPFYLNECFCLTSSLSYGHSILGWIPRNGEIRHIVGFYVETSQHLQNKGISGASLYAYGSSPPPPFSSQRRSRFHFVHSVVACTLTEEVWVPLWRTPSGLLGNHEVSKELCPSAAPEPRGIVFSVGQGPWGKLICWPWLFTELGMWQKEHGLHSPEFSPPSEVQPMRLCLLSQFTRCPIFCPV